MPCESLSLLLHHSCLVAIHRQLSHYVLVFIRCYITFWTSSLFADVKMGTYWPWYPDGNYYLPGSIPVPLTPRQREGKDGRRGSGLFSLLHFLERDT